MLHIYFKMNHFDAHLMVSSGAVDSEVHRMAIQFDLLFLMKRQNGKCNSKNFRQFLSGMSPDVWAFEAGAFTSDFKF